MQKGASIRLSGEMAEDVAKVLTVRLLEMGRNVEHVDEGLVKRFGGVKRVGEVCGLLSRNGVLVLVTVPAVAPRGEQREVVLEPHDTADFAAEKVIDDLATEGLLQLESLDYSAEDEELIRKRLADLGYIE